MKQANLREISQRTCQIIRDQRLAHELTQSEMANSLGISQSALSKIENLTMMPTLVPWLRFCEAFNLPPNLPLDEKLYRAWKREQEKRSARRGLRPPSVRLVS